ncbi:hypothetical protein HPB50_013877 [Hyalomma asiaticum]|uniref:Uncharacterized protein n=1 Tax=Hyalomma asiaticum TaxID=266040 RepID=A0ACB7SGQ8_HYAAI|nr:hypothetical protein HPB50_013877 [Hyalomma asiaticum]
MACTLERIPHQMHLGSGTVLVVVPGRAPLCLRCRNTGHIRRDCRVSRCSECRAFGHENVYCTRSYARAVRRSTGDRDELLMDEAEAANAALSSETPVASLQKSGDAGQEEEVETLQTPTATVTKEAACDLDAGDAAQCNATVLKNEEIEIQKRWRLTETHQSVATASTSAVWRRGPAPCSSRSGERLDARRNAL